MENLKKQKKASADKITRKEALQKAGKYAAFTAATMMVLLSSPNKAAAASAPPPADPPPWS